MNGPLCLLCRVHLKVHGCMRNRINKRNITCVKDARVYTNPVFPLSRAVSRQTSTFSTLDKSALREIKIPNKSSKYISHLREIKLAQWVGIGVHLSPCANTSPGARLLSALGFLISLMLKGWTSFITICLLNVLC